MLGKRISLVMAFVLIVTAVVVPGAAAQSATSQAWVSSITYYTPSTTGGTLQVSFYTEGNSTAIPYTPITLQPHAAGSLYLGTVNVLSAGFKGSAVLSSDVYVIATAVQFSAAESANYARLLYSGFTSSDASSTFFIPTVLNHQFGSTSFISVQNIDTADHQVDVKFYKVGETAPLVQKTFTIKAQSDLNLNGGSNLGGLNLPSGFNGSAVISAVGGTASDKWLVATSQETDDNGRGAYAFEGVAAGSNTVYMATMLCNAFGSQISTYAIQNASLTTAASVTVDFYNTAGTKIATKAATTVNPGGKISVSPCSENVPSGTSGSAVIHSTGAPVIAIGKVKATNGMATAFVGAAAGSTKIAAPYIRWAATPESEWRTNIAVMNVGSAAATNVVAKFYDGNGTLKSSFTLAGTGSPLGQFIKVSTNAQAAGALQSNGTFGIGFQTIPGGGSVEISSDQPLVVVVRASRNVSLGATTVFAEDYNGVSIP